MATVNHFEILADDLDRAVTFYRTVFGWKIQEWQDSGYFLIDTGEFPEVNKDGKTFTIGVNGAIMKRKGDNFKFLSQKGSGFVCYIGVQNYEESKAKIEEAGGKSLNEKTEMKGVGIYSYFEDTEGNVFGLIEPHPGEM